MVACVKCEYPWALPPFPTWEGVLAIETGDPRSIDDGWDNMGEMPKGITILMVEYVGSVSFCTFGLIPTV